MINIVTEEVILDDRASYKKQTKAESSMLQEEIGKYNEAKLMNALINMSSQVKMMCTTITTKEIFQHKSIYLFNYCV